MLRKAVAAHGDSAQSAASEVRKLLEASRYDGGGGSELAYAVEVYASAHCRATSSLC